MATRSLNVVISGDARQLGVATRQADGHLGKLEKSGAKVGKTLALGFATAGAAAGGALVLGLKKSVDAAKDAEASMAKVKTIVDNAGISFNRHAKEIDKVIQAHSKLTGFDDEELSESFANMVRTTGKLNEAYKLNALAADIARAKGTDLAGAQSLLARVYNGSFTGVKRLGIAIEPVTKAQDALKASTKTATSEQLKAAKAADKQATSQLAIAKLQKAFGGQAEAYGKTAAGAQERLSVAVENLQEKIGAKLLPVVADITNKLANFVSQMESGKGAGGRFAAALSDGFEKVKTVAEAVWPALRDGGQVALELLRTGLERAKAVIDAITPTILRMKDAITAWVQENGPAIEAFATAVKDRLSTAFSAVEGAVVTALEAVKGAVTAAVQFISGWIRKHRDDIAAFGHAWENIAKVVGVAVGALVLVVKAQIEHVLIPVMKVALAVVKAVWPSIKKVIEGVLQAIGGVIEVFSGIFTLDFKRAWEGIKDIFSGALKVILGLVKGAGSGLLAAAKGLGGMLKDGVVAGVKGLAGLLKDAIVASVELAARTIPRLIGKALGGLGKAITGGIKAGFEKLNPFGDGIGDGVGFISGGGGGTASLMGADPDLFPIVQAGGSFGLHTTSGLRPGSITSSGNVSYHSSGDAVDMAGPFSGMRRFAAAMYARGSRLRELISPWAQFGIKDGKPFRYSPAIQAQHSGSNAHVHVAYTGPFGDGQGRRGDGIGQAVSAARTAGFSGQALINMVAIAGAESGYDPTQQNLKYPDHSIGLWQINQLAHHGRFGTDAQLKNPVTNARAAYQLFKAGGYSPWSTWPTAARGYLAKARAAVSGGGSTPTAKSKSGRSVSVGADGVPREQPAPTTRTVTLSDGRRVRLPIMDDGPFLPFDGKSIKGINPDAPPPGPETSTVGDVQGGGGGLDSLLAAAPTAEDYALAGIARARLTPDKADDIAAATSLRDIRKRAMDRALDTADPRDDAAAIDAYLQAADALKTLTESTDEANRLAQQRLDIDAQIADNGKRMAAVAERTQGLQGQFLAWLSSAMGGTVALGMQAAGTPGQMARY